MSKTVYLNIKQMTEVHHKEIQLKDVADVYCDDHTVMNKCKSLRIKTIHEDYDKKYIENTLDVIKKLVEMDPSISVNNVGEVEYIIAYHKNKKRNPVWQWIKTIFLCIIAFSGASFAIMTFNNDVSVGAVFKEIYQIIMEQESSGFTILEVSYSIGLTVGIVGFFNHFSKVRMNHDPTPIEVEMRLYEENVSKTLIQNKERKECDIDVS